ncbi:MAG: outer membrane protein assembly factor BamE [Pontiellaceae bacterium]|nr:outer membrane protein assembly factor BamE [Pontiellaceae bacterium]MBN2785713.1 outer membrane protein assembly factor BamE [Pontiellaceae bacterium]
MKKANYIPSLALALFIAGCASTFHPSNLSAVKEGMSRDQVVQVLGEPDYVDIQDGAVCLVYSYRSDYNPTSAGAVPFYDEDSERVFKDLNNRRIFEDEEYVVVLDDNKVSRCDKR